MINFTMEDFEQADLKLETYYKKLNGLKKELAEFELKVEIAEEERNFIGAWLKRNGATKEEKEKIEGTINPIEF